MLRRALLTIAPAVGTLTGCPAPTAIDPDPAPSFTAVTEDPSDNPIPALSAAQQKAFDAGDAAFEKRFFPAQGLGPLYIRTSCNRCHDGDAKGPGFVQKMILENDDGTFTIPDGGATVRPFVEAGAVFPIVPPDDDRLRLSTRIGPAVFGRGFMEAVTDDAIEAQEAAQQNRDDGISGRIHRVTWTSQQNTDTTFHAHTFGETGLIGRFGLKARVATIDDFTADAFQGDMGLTSPMRPTELPNLDGLEDDLHPGVDLDLEIINDIAAYTRLLAIPTRFFDGDTAAAEALFADVRCAVCHVPALPTFPSYPVPQLAGIDAAIFSDLLLHDMGDALKDNITDGDASGREWRTAPLMGLRFFDGYLHDGRAATIPDAIAAHASAGSEANDSVDRFNVLGSEEQALLVRYVESL